MRKASLALTAINQERDSAPHILPMKPAVGLLTLNVQLPGGCASYPRCRGTRSMDS